MFRIHPRQNGFDLSITGHFLEVHMSEDDETCLYCHCDVTRGQGVKTYIVAIDTATYSLYALQSADSHLLSSLFHSSDSV